MNASNASAGKSDPSRATAGARGVPRPAIGICTLMASAMLVLSVPAIVSCTAVPASRQQRLAKANMVFDDTNAFAFSARLQPQSEPGTSATGAAQGGGCTACK
jgi:hypothetical protein